MTEQKTAAGTYQQLRDAHAAHLQQLLKKRNRIGWLRLGVAILTLVMTIQAFSATALLGYVALLAGITVFLFLVSNDATNNNRITRVRHLRQLNEDELQVLAGVYQQRFDGANYLPHQHPYAADLDLFGPASLFQYINRCSSEPARDRLAQNLLTGLPVEESRARQQAVTELAPQVEWRQELQAFLMQTPVTRLMQQKTETWLAEKVLHFTHKSWPLVVAAYSVITLASALAALLGFISPALFSFLFILYFTTATVLSSKATKSYAQLNGIVKEITTLQHGLQWIEEKKFESALVNRLQQAAKQGGETGHGQIKKLQRLLHRFDMRLNVYVFLFLNSFLLWDVRQMLGLNRWRRQNKEQVTHWFQLVTEMEVLNSLATLHFNQPDWTWPQFSNRHFTFRSTAIGHPLLPGAQRVTSNFTLEGTAKVALITGSNMAGKSTFLRSLGVNTVLAQLGAPVCATALELSPVQLMSSMRIADNLAENTSTFYAELKKLQTIIEAIKKHEPVFVLLDEVLRGTNSLDRHIGSKALIRQIIKEGAVAVMATHDVEVTKLKEDYPDAIHNYHFDVQVAGEELYFDYRLKEGVCTSLNASLLMKKIGIELE